MDAEAQAQFKVPSDIHPFDPNITSDATFIKTYNMISAANIEPLVIEVIQLQLQRIFYEQHHQAPHPSSLVYHNYGVQIKSSIPSEKLNAENVLPVILNRLSYIRTTLDKAAAPKAFKYIHALTVRHSDNCALILVARPSLPMLCYLLKTVQEHQAIEADPSRQSEWKKREQLGKEMFAFMTQDRPCPPSIDLEYLDGYMSYNDYQEKGGQLPESRAKVTTPVAKPKYTRVNKTEKSKVKKMTQKGLDALERAVDQATETLQMTTLSQSKEIEGGIDVDMDTVH